MDQVIGLTSRWARRLPEGNTVASGLGLWPLLAILATAADEPGRGELAAAAGVEPEHAAARAVDLIAELDASHDLHAALGVWVHEQLKLAESFDRVVPAPVRGLLHGDPARDKRELDAWAAEHTGGLIPEMPLEITPDLVLVLASALALRTRWAMPFEEQRRTLYDGPWTGSYGWLTRVDEDLDTVRRYDDLTVVTVHGDADVDVRLAIGADRAPREDVLAGLLEADPNGGTPGAQLLGAEPGTEVAPAVTVATTTSRQPDVQLSLPSFEVRAEHDLLALADVFGLGTVSSPPGQTGHFTAISPDPLRVSEARQTVLARFFATGFEAAAVTAVGMVRAAFITPQQSRLNVELNRPFAFAAFHRPTGNPVVIGWLDHP